MEGRKERRKETEEHARRVVNKEIGVQPTAEEEVEPLPKSLLPIVAIRLVEFRRFLLIRLRGNGGGSPGASMIMCNARCRIETSVISVTLQPCSCIK